MASEDPAILLKQLNELASLGFDGDSKTRKAAAALSRRLINALEAPQDRVVSLIYSPIPVMMAETAVNLNLFNLIASREEPVSSVELAALSGAEELLVSRVLRVLAANHYVHQAGEDLWTSTGETKAIAAGPLAAGLRCCWEIQSITSAKGPQYFRDNNYRSPTEPDAGLLQHSLGTTKSSFEYISSRPDLLSDFALYMGSTMGNQAYWYDWFPIQEKVLDEIDSSAGAASIVDVAGGKGHDLQVFRRKFPNSGRLVLQDLPEVLAGIREGELDPTIERQGHDFFSEQPEKGARAYFLHHILHDWSDKYCLKILEHIRQAMRPGYSKLLIHELLLPDVGASIFQAHYDIAMMNFNSGMERSRKQWQSLLTTAGFEIVDFWEQDDGDADGLIEAVVKS